MASGVAQGRVISNFHPCESDRINTARDCTDGYGRSRVILAKRKSISKERSAFNRIKHVLFLRPLRNPPRWQTPSSRRGATSTFAASRTRYLVLRLCYHISVLNNSYPRLRDSINPQSIYAIVYLKYSFTYEAMTKKRKTGFSEHQFFL